MALAARTGRKFLAAVERAAAGARFLAGLPFLIRGPIQGREARAWLRDGVARRAELFVDRVRRDIFGRPGSLYHTLFRHAGCEAGDVEALLRREGLEGALERLFRAGIYLTVDEFKGRTPLVRGSLRREVRAEGLRSPRAAHQLRAASGGSRSPGTPVLIDFRFVRACAANWRVLVDVWGGASWRVADWETPSAGARFRLLKFAAAGYFPAAWFSQIDPEDRTLPPFVRWNIKFMRAGGLLAGRRIPAPQFAPLSDPAALVGWLAEQLQAGERPFVFTFPGSAVRLCLAAAERGIDLAGACFLLGGEPITAARIGTIRRQGAIAIPRYGSMENGAIGYGCLRASAPDEVHVLANMHALIQTGDAGAPLGLPRQALLITNLHPHSPYLMVNVSMGDQAVLRRRDCGCPWAKFGLETTLAEIRSFEKLTGYGVTLPGTEIVHILEEKLPARFGGAPTDYQLIETETAEGRPWLSLAVHPAVGPVEERPVVEYFLECVGQISDVSRLMAEEWREAGLVRLVRRPPQTTRAGKILHLHQAAPENELAAN